jgi:hypothetical protein
MRHPQTYEIMNELRDRLIETYSDRLNPASKDTGIHKLANLKLGIIISNSNLSICKVFFRTS